MQKLCSHDILCSLGVIFQQLITIFYKKRGRNANRYVNCRPSWLTNVWVCFAFFVDWKQGIHGKYGDIMSYI